VVAVLACTGVVTVLVGIARVDRSNVGRIELVNRLAIPPILDGRDDGTGIRVYDLRVTAGRSELIPGTMTNTWGYNGPFGGPTLRASRGDRVRIDVTNGTEEHTTVHWHGMHLPAAMDGGPHQLIAPGATWSPTWTIDQPAATLWYHPHPHGRTADQVWQGAFGMFLIDDDTRVGLPDRYGVDDVPVAITDRSFRGDGSFDGGGFAATEGNLGNEILVNGTRGPVFDAITDHVRLRVLNASNTRVYDLGFTDDRPYEVVATDSGLLSSPVRVTRLELSPGERAEIVVALDPGDDVVLRSFPNDLGIGLFEARAVGANDTLDILRLRAADTLEPVPAPPGELVPAGPAAVGPGAVTRSFRFSGTQINGRSFDHRRPDAVATLNTDEVWEVWAPGGHHVFHLHDVRFRIVDVDGAPPPAVLAGWKDTFRLVPGRRYHLAVRFDDYADPDHGYMVHCHVLRHEDQGMMAQVVVVEPGAPEPDRLPEHRAGGG
jgi:blue copper oxidase